MQDNDEVSRTGFRSEVMRIRVVGDNNDINKKKVHFNFNSHMAQLTSNISDV